ncbi:alpha/beta hydrolase [Actinokineospora sp. 24-640]
MDISRRGLLGLGALAVLGACGKPGTAPVDPAVRPTVTPPTVETPSLSELVYRSGIGDVRFFVMRPREVSGDLPVCLALHGLGEDARQFVDLGLPSLLTATVRAGAPPFAVVAVDGGDWGAAAQRMLADELPEWLVAARLAPTAFAVLGVSTGATAAFTYAQTPGPALTAMVSPAVFSDWSDAQAFGLADETRWAATEPLNHVAGTPVSLWCGEEDELAPAVRLLAAHTGTEATFTPGAGHTAEYWKSVMPAVLRHVGDVLG